LIYTDEHIYRAIELRTLSINVKGSLCLIRDNVNLNGSLNYFDLYPYNGYFTNPYYILPTDLIGSMERESVLLLLHYVNQYPTKFTHGELMDIADVFNKHNMKLAHYNGFINICL